MGVPPDFIPDKEFTPDQNAPATQPGPTPDFISDNDFISDEDKYGTPGQQAIAGLEGVGQGVAGPLATAAERAFGVKGEDIRGRAEANPWTHGIGEGVGFAGSMLAGTGEAALIGHAGEAAAHGLGLGLEGASTLSKIAGVGARGATEMALLQAGDEGTKFLTGDPAQTVGSAVTNIGLSGLIGAGGGAVIGSVSPLWKATFGDKMGQFLEDFRGRFKERMNNPNPVQSLTDELTELHSGISGTADEVYGATGLKAREIHQVMPELSEKMTTQAQDLSGKVGGAIEEMAKKPNLYPERLTAKLQGDLEAFNQSISGAQSAGDIFNATQELKQKLQGYSKFDKFVKPVDEAYDFVGKAKGLGFDVRSALEDSSVWGKAAERQQAINKAFSEYLPTLKDFQKKFMVEVNGEKVIDPGKIQTFVNQLGKPNAEIKQQVLENFLKKTEQYRKVISDTHSNLGLEPPVAPSSLSATMSALKDVPAGAKAADVLINKGLANVAGSSLGAGIGGLAGHAIGSPGFGAMIGEHALGPFFSSILPAIAKPIIENRALAEGLRAASDYGIAAIRGEKLIKNASKNVFRVGEIVPKSMMPDEKDMERLDKTLKGAEADPSSLMKVGGHVGYYMPNHATTIAATSMGAVNYLNSLRPREIKNSPLDKPFENPLQKAVYQRALTVAEQPLVVLQHIKSGTLLPDDVTSIRTMYPALYAKLSSQLTEQMIAHVGSGESVPYKTRLGLSMFLGESLDSTMTQASIISTQMAQNRSTSMQQAQGEPQPKGKSMKALNKMGQEYATAGQAREGQRQSTKV